MRTSIPYAGKVSKKTTKLEAMYKPVPILQAFDFLNKTVLIGIFITFN